MANLNPFPVISGLIGSHQKLRRKISGGVLGGFSDIRSTYVPQKSILGVFGCGKPNRTVTVNITFFFPLTLFSEVYHLYIHRICILTLCTKYSYKINTDRL